MAMTEEQKLKKSIQMKEMHAKKKAEKEKSANHPCETSTCEIDRSEEIEPRNGFRPPENYIDPATVPQYIHEWEGRDVSILCPVYDNVNAATFWAVVATAADFGKEKIRLDMESGDSMIENSRNKLANRFLQTEAQWSIWLDDDVIPPIGRPHWFRFMTKCPRSFPEHMASHYWVHRLLSHNKTLVGALYFGRQAIGRPMFHEGVNTVEANRHARSYPNELMPTKWVGTGCMLVHRQVYIDIQQKYPELEFTHPDGTKEWLFFKKFDGMGEDASFCRRAMLSNHQPYVDLGLQCGHVGKATWMGHNTNDPLTSEGII